MIRRRPYGIELQASSKPKSETITDCRCRLSLSEESQAVAAPRMKMFLRRFSTVQKIALAGALQRPILWSRRIMGCGAVTQCRRRGIAWELDLNEGIDFSIFLQGRFEPSTGRALDRLVRNGDYVIDVGANVGAHTLPLVRRVGPGGRVIAIEPTEYAFAKLQRNIALNPDLASRISLHQLMLAEKTDTPLETEIYSSWPLHATCSNLHPVHRARGMVTTGARVSTLDQLLAEESLERVDLIKIDVDGHECGVFLGGQQSLSTFRPALVLELAPYALQERGGSMAELLSLLTPHGYRLFDEKTGAPLPVKPAEIEATIPLRGSRNAVALATYAATFQR